MLVLSRKVEESIMISNDIVIKIIRISGNQVKIGIEAPAHVVVSRLEDKTKTVGKFNLKHTS
jgi:carbon storage regulator